MCVCCWVSGRASAWEWRSRVSSQIPALLRGQDELGEAANESGAERNGLVLPTDSFGFEDFTAIAFLQLTGAHAGGSHALTRAQPCLLG